MRIREVTDVAVPPTCTENGLTEGKHCLVCNATLVEQETVLAVGHSFGEWTETKAPTVDEEGSEQRICSACNELETRSVDKLVNVFTDVPDNAFYASAVAWAAGQGINTGISATSFGPDEPCTRGQIVTFLWRSAGEPEPTSDVNPFLDVIPGDFYYNAVLWAVEAGITIGLTYDSFGPNDPCTRAQVATFLWRYFEEPTPRSDNPFTDVAAEDFYYTAVRWAVEEGVTNGMGDGCFAPDETCTRGQIVTFLYRALNQKG